MEHLAYMIDFGIFSIATAGNPWISMVFYSPFRVLKIQRRTTVKVGPTTLARHATQDRAGRYLGSKNMFRGLDTSVMWFLDVGR